MESRVGRLTSKQESGPNVVFFDLDLGGERVALWADAYTYVREAEPFAKIMARFKVGDTVAIDVYDEHRRNHPLTVWRMEKRKAQK